MAVDRGASLKDVADRYLVGLSDDQRRDGQLEVDRFIRWCGRDRGVRELTPVEVAGYGEGAGRKGSAAVQRLVPVKAFLSFLKKRGLTELGLASHLRAPKTRRPRPSASGMGPSRQVELSAEGYAKLQARRTVLQEDRIKIVSDIQRAMEDKDFKENAPLDAAKERQGQIESALRELEAILENAVIQGSGPVAPTNRVRLGHTVVLKEMASQNEVRYTLVDATEAEPAEGKISDSSPMGRALLEKAPGEEIRVSAPRGTMYYRIERIET